MQVARNHTNNAETSIQSRQATARIVVACRAERPVIRQKISEYLLVPKEQQACNMATD